jgi:hypothetical protein
MDRLKTRYESKFLDEFSLKKLIGVFTNIKFNNNIYYKGYIIGFIKDNIIVKFEKEKEIWKINMNNPFYILLIDEKKIVNINTDFMSAIKKKLKTENVIKNINIFAIHRNKDNLSVRSNIKKLGRKLEKAKWKNNYIKTQKIIKDNCLKSNKYLNNWFYTQKIYFKNKSFLLQKQRYHIKFQELIKLYNKSKLKPFIFQLENLQTKDFNTKNRDQIECSNLNKYSDMMHCNFDVTSKSPTSLSRSCNQDKVNYHIRNLVNLYRDIDNIKEISDNSDIKKWIAFIKAKTNI